MPTLNYVLDEQDYNDLCVYEDWLVDTVAWYLFNRGFDTDFLDRCSTRHDDFEDEQRTLRDSQESIRAGIELILSRNTDKESYPTLSMVLYAWMAEHGI